MRDPFLKPPESVSLQKSCYVAASITSQSFPDFLNLSESRQEKAVFVQRHNTSLHSKFRQTTLKLTPKGLDYTQIGTLIFKPLRPSVPSLKIKFINAALWFFGHSYGLPKVILIASWVYFLKPMKRSFQLEWILYIVVAFVLAGMGIQTLTILAEWRHSWQVKELKMTQRKYFVNWEESAYC